MCVAHTAELLSTAGDSFWTCGRPDAARLHGMHRSAVHTRQQTTHQSRPVHRSGRAARWGTSNLGSRRLRSAMRPLDSEVPITPAQKPTSPKTTPCIDNVASGNMRGGRPSCLTFEHDGNTAYHVTNLVAQIQEALAHWVPWFEEVAACRMAHVYKVCPIISPCSHELRAHVTGSAPHCTITIAGVLGSLYLARPCSSGCSRRTGAQ